MSRILAKYLEIYNFICFTCKSLLTEPHIHSLKNIKPRLKNNQNIHIRISMLKLCDANGVLILKSEEQRDRATEILKICLRNSTNIAEAGLRINDFVKQAREATKELDCGVKTWSSAVHSFTDMITKGIKKEKTRDVYFTSSRLK